MNTENITITIHSVKTLACQIQAQAFISIKEINDGKPFGYLLSLNDDEEDASDISKYIKEKIKSGEVKLEPSEVSIDDINFNDLRNKAESLLRSTDQFMTIDTELTDDEVKEMKSYRASLRSIVKAKDYKNLSKLDLPDLPKFLKKDMYHITYIGSQSQEK